MSSSVRLLDTTLRDGSYVVDFQFTAQDTVIIAGELENAGLRLIEIGHGLGLHASNCGKGRAAESDEAYLEAAASVLKASDWGTFFIPGIGRPEDLQMAVRYGMKFVRIGTNVTEVESALPLIELAKSLGFWVSCNFMKTYALPEAEVAKHAALVQRAGADIAVVVDSAGGMLPEDVARYMNAMRSEADIAIGFHGHDNLGLAIANTLKAVECGAAVIDSSLLGIGRSAGNAMTEIMVLLLKKKGLDLNIDAKKLMDLSERVIKPMMQRHKHDPISMTAGYAQFHSSYLGTILSYAERYRLDPRDLIIRVCERDQLEAPDELVQQIAKGLADEKPQQGRTRVVQVPFYKAALTDPSESKPIVELVLRELKKATAKYGKRSVFSIIRPLEPGIGSYVARFIQERFSYVIGSAEIATVEELKRLLGQLDGEVDYILLDDESGTNHSDEFYVLAKAHVYKSNVMRYKDTDLRVRGTCAEIEELCISLSGKKVTLVGVNSLALKLACYLLERGAEVVLTGDTPEILQQVVVSLKNLPLVNQGAGTIAYSAVGRDAAAGAFIMVGCAPKIPTIMPEMIDAMDRLGLVVDMGVGSLSSAAIKRGSQLGIRMIRVDMRAAIASEIVHILGVQDVAHRMMGRGEISGVPVVAGGMIGERGDIIVDSIDQPTQVIGIADGSGYVLYEWSADDRLRMQRVEAELVKNILG